MKKVLLVAYYYPPAAGVGTFRVTKFVKYLSNFGWQPTVVTVRDKYYNSLDESILDDSKKAKYIYKTEVSNLPINDVGLKWTWHLYREIKRIIELDKIDVVYYTGGPFFQWIIAARTQTLTGVPFVIDYRDPWGINPYEKKGKGIKKKIGDQLTKMFEPRIINSAFKIIFATTDMQTEYIKAFPKEAKKFVVIENGFDADDYSKVKPMEFQKFTITYTGKFSNYRNPENLFKAISTFADIADCQFIHVGNKEQYVSDLAQKYLPSEALFTGVKKYSEALSYAKGSDVLVLISGGSNIEFTHKVFDYVSCGKPIIAIVDKESYLGRFLENFDNAFVIKDSENEIFGTLKYIHDNNITSLGADNGGVLKKYHRQYLTSCLAKVLDEVKL